MDDTDQLNIQYGKVVEKSIIHDLMDYDLPEDVILKADYCYKEISSKIRRQNKRVLLYFYCVLKAYRELYGAVDPNSIRKTFGLTQGDIMKSVSTFSNKRVSEIIYTSPVDLIPDYCRRLKIKDECVEDIVKIGESIIKSNPTLKNDSPQTVAAGIIWYHLSTIGVDNEKKEFSSIVDRTPATVKKMYIKIATFDNVF